MSTEQSLYEVLGISKDASAEDIKRAYRKLVQIHHPDKAGSSPEATERFALICKAYEILSDSEKRALYDKPRRARTFYRSSWRPPKGAHFSESSPDIEPRPTHRSSSRRPSWQQPQNNLNLDDLFSGSGNPGPRPQMGGRYTQNQSKPGVREDGVDIHLDVDVPARTAQRGGMVQFEYRRNRRTDGLEVQSVLELFYLRVPSGTQDGQVLDIVKMGHAGHNGGRSGDLHCTVRIIDESTSQDAESTQSTYSHSTGEKAKDTSQESSEQVIPITFPEAVLGGRVTLDTPMGAVTISIPAGTSSGRKLRIRGQGVGGGDFIVTLQIVVPSNLDEESIRLVKEFADRNPLSPR